VDRAVWARAAVTVASGSRRGVPVVLRSRMRMVRREQFDLVLVLTDRHGGTEERARALDGLTRCERREA